MRESDGLYYAPGVRYSDLRDGDLALLLKKRLRGWLLEPARGLVERREDLAALCVLLSLLEALAEFYAVSTASPDSAPLDRLKTLLVNFAIGEQDARHEFVNLCRNGVVHHGRLNCGSEIDRTHASSLRLLKDRAVSVNVFALLSEAERVLETVISAVSTNPEAVLLWEKHFQRVFRRELNE